MALSLTDERRKYYIRRLVNDFQYLPSVTEGSKYSISDLAWIYYSIRNGNLDPVPPVDPPISKPDTTNTGPRITPSGSVLNTAQAVAAARANGGVLTGAIISDWNNTDLEVSADRLIFEDCEITGTFYAIQSYFDDVPTPDDPLDVTTFRYCDIHGALASGFAGQNLVFKHNRFHRNVDHAKPTGNVEMYGNLMHHMWAPDETAHGDVIQIQSGRNILIHYNTLIGINAPDSPYQPGTGLASGVLQMGAPFGDVQVTLSDNWVDGGVYSLRGCGETWTGSEEFEAELIIRRTQQGRGFGSGPVTDMGSFDNGRVVSDYDLSNVFEDTGLPVLG